VINFQGDYGMKLLMVDAGATIDEVAQLAKDQLVGVVIKPLPEGAKLRVRRHSDEVFLDGDLKVGTAGLVRMEALDILYS
jgi:toluene monooxygenase system protein B